MCMFAEIEKWITIGNPLLLCYYFRKEIKDFNKIVILYKNFGEKILVEESQIELLIEYGFYQSTLEYCLKYDDINIFRDIKISDHIDAKWSPFEWSRKTDSLDYLSFSGYFGPIMCFKYFLMNGFDISDEIKSLVVCNGSFDLYHLCNEKNRVNGKSIFFLLSLFKFL